MLVSARRMDPDLGPLAERLEALESELQDVAVRAADYLAELEIDPVPVAAASPRWNFTPAEHSACR